MLFSTKELDDRIHPITDAEFDDLDRTASGRIVQLSDIFYLLSDEQVKRLHADDWSYYNELEEEIRAELREFLGSNGGMT